MSYLLCGQNALLLDERVAALVSDLDQTGLGTTVIDVQTSTLEAIASACHASPFFGGTRMVVLRQPLVLPKRGDDASADEDDTPPGRIRWPDLLQILRSTPPTSEIIVRHDGSLTATHFARKALKELGWTIEPVEIPRGADLLAWVTTRAQGNGYSFGPGAAERLLDLLFPLSWSSTDTRYVTTTPDTRLIASEIEKLALASDEDVVSVAVVDSLIEDRSGYKAFELSNAIFSGRVEQALCELDLMIEAGEAPERVLFQIAGDVVATAQARLALEYPSRDVATVSGLTDRRVDTLKTRHYSHATLRMMAELVRHADSNVKTGHAAQTAAVITPLVAQLSEAARTPPGRR
ncbi:MAG TPA: hypothetical protein VMM78_13570 [Thermomicrobiales bacterium]|nr:hypothetical protein [Thermomicrobiales bacterium]